MITIIFTVAFSTLYCSFLFGRDTYFSGCDVAVFTAGTVVNQNHPTEFRVDTDMTSPDNNPLPRKWLILGAVISVLLCSRKCAKIMRGA